MLGKIQIKKHRKLQGLVQVSSLWWEQGWDNKKWQQRLKSENLCHLLFSILYFLRTSQFTFISDIWEYCWEAYSQVRRLTVKNSRKYTKMLLVGNMKILTLFFLLFFSKCPHWIKIYSKNILGTYITMVWWKKHLHISLESHESIHKPWLSWKLTGGVPKYKRIGQAF